MYLLHSFLFGITFLIVASTACPLPQPTPAEITPIAGAPILTLSEGASLGRAHVPPLESAAQQAMETTLQRLLYLRIYAWDTLAHIHGIDTLNQADRWEVEHLRETNRKSIIRKEFLHIVLPIHDEPSLPSPLLSEKDRTAITRISTRIAEDIAKTPSNASRWLSRLKQDMLSPISLEMIHSAASPNRLFRPALTLLAIAEVSLSLKRQSPSSSTSSPSALSWL